MAAFLGGVLGRRNEATRLGSATSGLSTRAQTWNLQVRVDLTMADGTPYVAITAHHLDHPSTTLHLYGGTEADLLHLIAKES